MIDTGDNTYIYFKKYIAIILQPFLMLALFSLVFFSYQCCRKKKKDDIKIEIKETENFRKIKNFLMEKEKQRAKFNEKMSKISIPELQQLSGSSGSVMFRGDFNRKKKFLELVEKLQQKNNPARKNIVSNTELYEECQNNQIHENNWEGFVRQKFQNIY